jgi:hypothetical protein
MFVCSPQPRWLLNLALGYTCIMFCEWGDGWGWPSGQCITSANSFKRTLHCRSVNPRSGQPHVPSHAKQPLRKVRHITSRSRKLSHSGCVTVPRLLALSVGHVLYEYLLLFYSVTFYQLHCLYEVEWQDDYETCIKLSINLRPTENLKSQYRDITVYFINTPASYFGVTLQFNLLKIFVASPDTRYNLWGSSLQQVIAASFQFLSSSWPLSL